MPPKKTPHGRPPQAEKVPPRRPDGVSALLPHVVVTTVAGSEQHFEDGPADVAAFNYPQGIVVDERTRALAVTDGANGRLRWITQPPLRASPASSSPRSSGAAETNSGAAAAGAGTGNGAAAAASSPTAAGVALAMAAAAAGAAAAAAAAAAANTAPSATTMARVHTLAGGGPRPYAQPLQSASRQVPMRHVKHVGWCQGVCLDTSEFGGAHGRVLFTDSTQLYSSAVPPPTASVTATRVHGDHLISNAGHNGPLQWTLPSDTHILLYQPRAGQQPDTKPLSPSQRLVLLAADDGWQCTGSLGTVCCSRRTGDVFVVDSSLMRVLRLERAWEQPPPPPPLPLSSADRKAGAGATAAGAAADAAAAAPDEEVEGDPPGWQRWPLPHDQSRAADACAAALRAFHEAHAARGGSGDDGGGVGDNGAGAAAAAATAAATPTKKRGGLTRDVRAAAATRVDPPLSQCGRTLCAHRDDPTQRLRAVSVKLTVLAGAANHTSLEPFDAASRNAAAAAAAAAAARLAATGKHHPSLRFGADMVRTPEQAVRVRAATNAFVRGRRVPDARDVRWSDVRHLCWERTADPAGTEPAESALWMTVGDNGFVRIELPRPALESLAAFRKDDSTGWRALLPDLWHVVWRYAFDPTASCRLYRPPWPHAHGETPFGVSGMACTSGGYLLVSTFTGVAALNVRDAARMPEPAAAGDDKDAATAPSQLQGEWVAGVFGAAVAYRDGLGAEARFNDVRGLDVSETERCVYVIDNSNHLVRRMALPDHYFAAAARAAPS